MPSSFFFLSLSLAALSASAAPPTPPCAAPPGVVPILSSSLCYTEVAPKDPSGVEVRQYTAPTNATFVLGSGAGAYNAGLQGSIASVISYFSGNNDEQRNILAARTVPFLITQSGPYWTAHLEIDPLQFPDNFLIPRPNPQNSLALVSDTIGLMGVFQFNTTGMPYHADFEEACGVIQNSTLPKGYAVNTTNPFSPTYVFYNGMTATDFTCECWMAVYKL
jgi:hypothetical protein